MRKIITLLLGFLGLNAFSACVAPAYEETDVEGFSQLSTQSNVLVVDVRTPEEYAEGHIPGAILIDVKKDDFKATALQLLDKSKTIAVYCRSGRRSAQAADVLTTEGFKAVNLKGGILAWKSANKPTDQKEVDAFMTPNGKTITFTALMHASIRIQIDGKVIDIDPVGQMGQRTTNYAMMPKADYLFVTHEHGDHFDKNAIALLKTDKTRLVTNQRCAEMLGEGDAMANGEKKSLDFIQVEAVPAYNYTEGRTQFHPKGRDNGFILTIDGLRIYIAGDTEDVPEMADIHNIDIAFMPCNQPYTMTTNQLVKAAQVVKPKVLFPYHYGSTDVSGIPSQLKNEGIDTRIRHYE
jgi:L-ascorbate metabolism protein UlaG (beta-lactamase superfamily)/rhodanese-related sulfurtransferase